MNDSEDNLDTLEIYISTIEELIEKFDKKKERTKLQKDEVKNIKKFKKIQFFSQYIELEDKILSFIDKHIGIKDKDMENLINKFLKYWKNYQDSWSDEYWKIYNKFSLIQNNCEKSEINYDNNLQNLLKKDIEELFITEENEENKNNNSNNKIDNLHLQKFDNLLFENGNFLKNPNSQAPAVKIRKENKRLFHVKRSRNTVSIGLSRFDKPENKLTSSFMDRDKNINIGNVINESKSSDEDSENDSCNNNNKELKAILNDTKRQSKNKEKDLMKEIDLDIENEISKTKIKGNEISLIYLFIQLKKKIKMRKSVEIAFTVKFFNKNYYNLFLLQIFLNNFLEEKFIK